jgi:CheY-like chemotaxis protein
VSTDLSKPPVILLVEDSPDDVFFFERALAKVNLPTVLHVAENGRIATDYFLNRGKFSDTQSYPMPDVVFLDLKMPEMNGFELMAWVQKKYGELPFRTVVLTSSDEPKDYQQALDAGAHGYILKPISTEQITAQIARRLDRAPVAQS